VGFLLPGLWLVLTDRLYAWVPGFRGSATLFGVTVAAAFVAVGAATLGATSSWPRRLCLAAVCWIMLAVEIAGILGWAFFAMSVGTSQPRLRATAEWMKPIESAWCLQSPGQPHSVQVSSEYRRFGDDSLRFELRAGEFYADLFGKVSHRSEVNVRDFPPVGSTRRYAFSLLLPKDFPIEDNRLVLVQWHGADKKYLGERARSPSLAFRYSGGRFSITLRHSADRIVRQPGTVPSVTLFETAAFPHGEWHDFVVEAKWSPRSDGGVMVWWNGRQIVRYAGPVGYNDDFGPYFKFGIYRDDTDKTYVVYFNQVRIQEGTRSWPDQTLLRLNGGSARQFGSPAVTERPPSAS